MYQQPPNPWNQQSQPLPQQPYQQQPPREQLPPARIIYTIAGFVALIIIAFLFVANLGIQNPSTTNGGSTDASSNSDTTSNTTADWHTTHTFSGTTQENTAPITIDSGQWQILWTCQATSNDVDGVLAITLHNPNTTDPIDVPVNADCPAGQTSHGSTYDYKTGTFYLEINSANVNWTVEIQEQ